MKHLEPVPTAQPQQTKFQKRSLIRSEKWLLFSLVAVILTAGFTMTTFFRQPSEDHLSDAEKTRISEEFSKKTPVQLAPVPTTEFQAAIDSMGLDKVQKAALQQHMQDSISPQSVQQGNEVRLMYLELWDFATQDGDSVYVSSGGYQATLPLFKTPTKIAIPVRVGQAIQVGGVHDGGGGITLGIKNGQGQVILPVLAPGQTVELPVAL